MEKGDASKGLNLSGLVPFVVCSVLPLASLKFVQYVLKAQSDAAATADDHDATLEDNDQKESDQKRKLLVLYGTVTGTASEMATALYEDLLHIDTLSVEICNVKDFNDEELEKQDVVIFVCCTWSEGSPPEAAAPFMTWLVDMSQDFRVSKNLFGAMSFAAFGLGSKVYGGKMFCKPVNIVLSYLC